MQELKQRLSALLAEAAAGERILITRHRRPLAVLASAQLEHVQLGPRFGKGSLRPLFNRATKGRYLEVLVEDRAEDR
jgi:prevent-host-death family protein